MQRPYINIGAARSHGAGSPACLEVCINKRAYILVLLFAQGAGTGKVGAYLAAAPPVTIATFAANRRWTFAHRS